MHARIQEQLGTAGRTNKAQHTGQVRLQHAGLAKHSMHDQPNTAHAGLAKHCMQDQPKTVCRTRKKKQRVRPNTVCMTGHIKHVGSHALHAVPATYNMQDQPNRASR
jgi:hypothetical protein